MQNIVSKILLEAGYSFTESVSRDKSRKVLFIDEHGKNIVYDDGDFRIAVDDKDDARYNFMAFRRN